MCCITEYVYLCPRPLLFIPLNFAQLNSESDCHLFYTKHLFLSNLFPSFFFKKKLPPSFTLICPPS